MKFRKQLVKRMFNHICYTFTLDAVTPETQMIYAAGNGDVFSFKFYQGQLRSTTRPVISYYEEHFYKGYGGRITVGHRQFSIVRIYVPNIFVLCPIHVNNAYEHEIRFDNDEKFVIVNAFKSY